MNKLITILILNIVLAFSTNASDLAKATYVLQVSSNLGCVNLDIELISDKLDTPQYVKFTSSAYGATTLPQGEYTFGSVICIDKEGRQELDVLKGKIMAFSLSAGKVYYGGRLIFKKVEGLDVNSAPKVIENCTQMISSARGEPSNECSDGVGVDTAARKNYQVNVYAPEVTEKDIEIVRTALSLSENQLIYLPIKYKKN